MQLQGLSLRGRSLIELLYNRLEEGEITEKQLSELVEGKPLPPLEFNERGHIVLPVGSVNTSRYLMEQVGSRYQLRPGALAVFRKLAQQEQTTLGTAVLVPGTEVVVDGTFTPPQMQEYAVVRCGYVATGLCDMLQVCQFFEDKRLEALGFPDLSVLLHKRRLTLWAGHHLGMRVLSPCKANTRAIFGARTMFVFRLP